MYTTDALVRVDPPDLNELGVSSLDRQSLPPTPSLSNEIAVMQSRSVAEPVIQRFDCDISTTPRSLPILGAIVKEFAVPGVLAEPWLRLGSIAWGGEELKGEIHPLRRDPQGGRRPLFDQICFIQSVPLPSSPRSNYAVRHISNPLARRRGSACYGMPGHSKRL
jgi:hypothetical protein